ncbi:MAG: sugar ABC transporter substrate-binding protein [Erysipelotrichaceae bacterium]|nr:sugar ABC transporter substrate-binding protein [Erysipelotrichaceae bacterium]
MKKLLTIMVSVLLLLSFVGCNKTPEKPDDKKLVVGLSVVDMKNQFWVDWSNAMKEEADAQGVELLINDAAGDIAKQIEALENWHTQGVNAVVVMPVDPSLQSYVDKLMADNIPVICGATRLENIAGFVGVVQAEYGYNIGKAAAEWINANLADKEVVKLAVLTNSTSANLVTRSEGILKGLEENCKVKYEIVDQQDAYTSEQGVSVAETILQAHPDLDGFVGITDSGMLGAYEAVVASGKDTSKMFLVACDGDSKALKLIKDNTCYRATVAINKAGTGKANMQQAIAAAKGEKITDIATVTTPVTIDNVDAWCKQNGITLE